MDKKEERAQLEARLKEIAKEHLIDEIRFIDAEDLTEDHVGDPQKFSNRQPKTIMPGAKSIILAAIYIGKFVTASDANHGRMSRLVLSGYYANIVKPMEALREELIKSGYRALLLDGENDEEQIPLKGTAVKAGLGWIGKHSILIHPKYGTFLALGGILTDADLGIQYPIEKNRCDGCHRCMDICPTKAIETPQVIDIDKCLSNIMDQYISGDDIPPETDTDQYFFECDICQNACPWNGKHLKSPLATPYGERFDRERVEKLLDIKNLEQLGEESYKKNLTPLMEGYVLPYKTFCRNLNHIRHQSKCKE
jgi:epoxyqueuosine reductase